MIFNHYYALFDVQIEILYSLYSLVMFYCPDWGKVSGQTSEQTAVKIVEFVKDKNKSIRH